MTDDRSGKPKSAEQALAEMQEAVRRREEILTRNLLRVIGTARRLTPTKEEFADFEEGIVTLFSDLQPDLGDWARFCVRRARELHEARQ